MMARSRCMTIRAQLMTLADKFWYVPADMTYAAMDGARQQNSSLVS